jgi:alginate production protein
MTIARVLCVLLGLAAGGVEAQEIYYAVRTSTSYGQDGERDLGLTDDDENQHFQLNLAPRALIAFSPSWTGYLRGRIYLPTSRASPFDLEQADNAGDTNGFAGLNEFWLQFNGITSYPGEAVRLGRQRIRQSDGEWWDQDADSLRWFMDTTLRSAEVGVAHQFSNYRTDSALVPLEQRDRTYLFARVATRLGVNNTVGARVTHTMDHNPLPAIGSFVSAEEKLSDADLTWIGLYAAKGFYESVSEEQRFAYAIDATYLTGTQDVATRDISDTITSHLSQTVGAWNASAAFRVQPLSRFPVHVGGAYTYSQGGQSGGRSQQYRQAGMQSNSSYFTGTQTLTSRYNEMLQPELGNLRIITGFASFDFENQSASVIFERFRKDDSAAPIITQNVTVLPSTTSADIGNGVDLVYAYYFGRTPRTPRMLETGDAFLTQERRSLISLRASMFQPGDAYDASAKSVYRLMLEVTLWWD